jgi:hypothetical protein
MVILAASVLCVSLFLHKIQPPIQQGRCRLKFNIFNQKDIPATASLAYYRFQHTAQKPDQINDLPKGVSSNVSYFLGKLDDKEITAIKTTSKRPILYMDTDGDGSLSDEKRFAAKPIRQGWFGRVEYYRFGPISIKLGENKKITSILYGITYPNQKILYLRPAGQYTGKILLGDKVYTVFVTDGNFDGRLETLFSPPFKGNPTIGCDSFAIDLNNDENLNFSYFDHSEVLPLSRMVKLDNTYYSIDITPDSKFLELKKVEPELGILDLGGADVKLKLWSDAAEQYLAGSEKEWQLPSGKYAALSIEINKDDAAGNRWSLISHVETGAMRDFEIYTGQSTSFKIGPPFQIKTTVQKSRNTVSIVFELEEQAGEHYRADVRKNSSQVPVPLFKLVDEAGNIIKQERFQYG